MKPTIHRIQLKFMLSICSVLLLTGNASASERFVNMPIETNLQTQLELDLLYPMPTDYSNLVKTPGQWDGSFLQSPCGPHMTKMLVKAITQFEATITSAVAEQLTQVYAKQGLKILSVKVNLPYVLNNRGIGGSFRDALTTDPGHSFSGLIFNLSTYSYLPNKNRVASAIVSSSDGKQRDFMVSIMGSFEFFLSPHPYVIKEYSPVGDLISTKSICKVGVNLDRPETYSPVGIISNSDGTVRIANFHLPYVMVNWDVEL